MKSSGNIRSLFITFSFAVLLYDNKKKTYCLLRIVCQQILLHCFLQIFGAIIIGIWRIPNGSPPSLIANSPEFSSFCRILTCALQDKKIIWEVAKRKKRLTDCQLHSNFFFLSLYRNLPITKNKKV